MIISMKLFFEERPYRIFFKQRPNVVTAEPSQRETSPFHSELYSCCINVIAEIHEYMHIMMILFPQCFFSLNA